MTSNISSASSAFAGQPIRITEEALEPLLYCLAHSIEFQRALNADVQPVEVNSGTLGLTYSACMSHHKSLVEALPAALDRVRGLPMSVGSGESAGTLFIFRVRVSKVTMSSRLGGWMTSKNSTTIEEWEFTVLMQKNDVLVRRKGGASSSPQPSSGAFAGNPSITSKVFTPDNASTSSDSRFASPLPNDSDLTFCNDPRQIRDAVNFIINKSFEAIDTCFARDFASASELSFEISVDEKTAY